MNYKNDQVRRQDRLLDQEKAIELLKKGEYGVLSLIAPENEAYGLPVNYAWNGENAIYIHCAPVGRKLRSIDFNNNASFCIVGRTHLLPSQFSTEYESIILKCTASFKLSKEEKTKALMLILEKYSPEEKETGPKYIEKLFERTEIIKLEIIEYSGKTKKVH